MLNNIFLRVHYSEGEGLIILQKTDGKIVIYFHKPRIIGFIIFGLLFSIVNFLILLSGLNSAATGADTIAGKIFIELIGLFGLLISLPSSIYYIKRLFSHNPCVIIDDNGIFVHATYAAVGYLYWSEIETACIYTEKYRGRSQAYVGITLKNRDEFTNRFHGLKRHFIKASRYPVNIPELSVNVNIDELCGAILYYLSKQKTVHYTKIKK